MDYVQPKGLSRPADPVTFDLLAPTKKRLRIHVKHEEKAACSSRLTLGLEYGGSLCSFYSALRIAPIPFRHAFLHRGDVATFRQEQYRCRMIARAATANGSKLQSGDE